VGRSFDAWFVVCALLALGLPAAPSHASGESGFALEGFWHLTIHYRDEASENPQAERWDDRLWRFEQRGSRMQWTEFPVVVFEHAEGRYEPGSGEHPARSLTFWEPSPAQLAEIREGVTVNPRGARSKGLRGSTLEGYRSVGGLQSGSTGVIGYSESWSIEGLPERPVFTQAVVMGSGRTEDLEGRTRYTVLVVSEDGQELRGRYERDGTREGTFVLRRAAEPAFVGGRRSGSS
jgi:hypothetical protein